MKNFALLILDIIFTNFKTFSRQFQHKNIKKFQYNSIDSNKEVLSMRDSSNRTISQALAIYLYQLKTGNSQESIANHFNKVTRRQVSSYCKQIRKALILNFVPQNIGPNHLKRDAFLQHKTKIAKCLLNLGEETMEANESRLVTKLRYVVEVTNCFCKRSFQALREVQNQSLKHTIEDY